MLTIILEDGWFLDFLVKIDHTSGLLTLQAGKCDTKMLILFGTSQKLTIQAG